MAWNSHAATKKDNNDWDIIWQRKMPNPRTVNVDKIGELGKDLEKRKWQMISTQYHHIYYQPSTNIKKVSDIYSLIDNVYEFLKGRSPIQMKTPIKVFLVPNEWGRSRCCKTSNAMRTGDQADANFILTSILHEETHLFNFAFLNRIKQGWWAGEFFCIYFQQRALWETQGKNVKNEIASRLPNGPRCHLNKIGKRGKEAFDEAISVLYFLEEKYGRQRSIRFRHACLEESRRTKGRLPPDSIFVNVFDKDIDRLQQEWLQFYGWSSTRKKNLVEAQDPRLLTKISYTAKKASVQNTVIAMANKAGLKYNWNKSVSQTGSLSRNWVKNVRINNRPLHEALKKILDPLGLSYKLEDNEIVLYKK
jgi:hypothetical protein